VALRSLVFDATQVPDAMLDLRWSTLQAPGYREYFDAMFSGDLQKLADTWVIADEELAKIKVPYTLVHGRDDLPCPVGVTSLVLAEKMRNSSVVLLANCGHAPGRGASSRSPRRSAAGFRHLRRFRNKLTFRNVQGEQHATKMSRRQVLEGMALGLIGLTAAGRAVAQARSKLRLVLPTPPTTYQLPYLVAKDTGWYTSVVWTSTRSLSAAIPPRCARDLGVCRLDLRGPATVFNAVLEGAKIKYIGPRSRGRLQHHRREVRASLAAIADQTFASAGPSDLTTEIPKLMMKKLGINTDKVKFIQVGGHSARLQALEVGKVQGTMVNTLTMTIGQKNGQIKVLANVAKEFPQLGYVMYAAMTASVSDRRCTSLRDFHAGRYRRRPAHSVGSRARRRHTHQARARPARGFGPRRDQGAQCEQVWAWMAVWTRRW
jgi:hypothetical protein